MDLALAQLRADIASGDSSKQLQALALALQYSASGVDISSLGKRICEEIVRAPAGPVTKKLAYDVIRSTRLTAEHWEAVCKGVANDLEYHDRDVTATAAAFLTAIPSWKIGKFILEHSKEITACIVDPNPNLRQAVLEALGCLLARDDIILLCSTSGNLLDRVTAWYKQIGQSMLDSYNQVSRAAFEAVGHLFAEFSGKRLSRLAGDKLIPGEASVAVRCQFVMTLADIVWAKRDLLMARAAVLPFESLRYTVVPLVFAARARITGLLDEMRVLAGIQPDAPAGGDAKTRSESAAAENILGISDIVSHLAPYLTSLDPALVYEVGINLLALASVPGGKPEWAAAPISAFLALWDRQEYGAGREALVRAVASNIQLLDLHLQVALFKRLLLMVRNLRVEADRMHALARVCRTALAVDLFAKESVRRGQRPLPGTDVSSLFEDVKTREELSAVSGTGLFREELVACLVESCFQLSQPLPESSASGNRVLGSLSLATSQEAMGWTHAALGVVEVCRPCVKWDCNGRTYAMDSYLRLLVRLCHLYETSAGVKSAKDGATSEQILAEQRLQVLQRQLLADLKDVATRRMRVRLLWSLCEHLNLDGLNPLLADDPTDPVNILVFNLHELLFNVDSGTALVTNRLQDVQALLLGAQHLGARNPRAASLLIQDLENFRGSSLADTVNKNQCRLVVNVLKYIQEKPLARWTGWVQGTGEYPFGHQKLSVQYNEPASAQDRKLEDLVKTAVRELWRPPPSELALAVTGGRTIRPVSPAKTLSGSSDPCFLEASHLADVNERKLTLNMKVVNVTELQLSQVDVRVGLDGAVNFLDKTPQALRQLKDLAAQDPALVDVTVTVSKFERCTLNVQLLYYPGGGDPPAVAALDETPLNEYGDILPRSRRGSVSSAAVIGRGEPVVLRCKPYRVPLTELLLPAETAPVDFFRLWPTLPAMADFTCAYEYDPTDKDSQASGAGLPPFMSGLAALSGKPLARVCSHIVRTTQGFQLCYLARTWFGDTLAMVVFGNSEPATVGGFGDDVTVASCRFVFRSSSEHVVAEIKAETQFWFDDLTDGAVRLLTDREVEADARAKLERAMQPVHLTLPPIKTRENDSLIPGMGPKAPATGQAEEQMALQTAVLQEWHVLRAQQVH